MQTQRIQPRSVLGWLDRQPDRVCWPLGFAVGLVPSLGLLLLSPSVGLVTSGLMLGAAVWLGLTGDPIALPGDDLHEPIEMIELPGGEFSMGSPENEPGRYDDENPHRVRVSAFAMAKYPVTQKLYADVMGTNPAFFQGHRLPVEQVSWFEAVRFCNKLSEKAGLRPCYAIVEPKPGADQPADGEAPQAEQEVVWDRAADGYRLPTEAEWEYACRAGTKGETYGPLDAIAWHDDNSGHTTHPVGQKQANSFGLYDMLGNVWQWCLDWYDDGYYKQFPSVDPQGPTRGKKRVLRGGAWDYYAPFFCAAGRYSFEPPLRERSMGFRLVCLLAGIP